MPEQPEKWIQPHCMSRGYIHAWTLLFSSWVLHLKSEIAQRELSDLWRGNHATRKP